jgi:hypothetical protein
MHPDEIFCKFSVVESSYHIFSDKIYNRHIHNVYKGKQLFKQ